VADLANRYVPAQQELTLISEDVLVENVHVDFGSRMNSSL
jgi:hypothetical protein